MDSLKELENLLLRYHDDLDQVYHCDMDKDCQYCLFPIDMNELDKICVICNLEWRSNEIQTIC